MPPIHGAATGPALMVGVPARPGPAATPPRAATAVPRSLGGRRLARAGRMVELGAPGLFEFVQFIHSYTIAWLQA
jgi:hypothetical protein